MFAFGKDGTVELRAPDALGLHELVELGAGFAAGGLAQRGQGRHRQPGRAERLPSPAAEVELVDVVGDQTVGEAER